MENNYKGYSLFKDVKDVKLRTWNRCATAFNINASNKGDSEGYLACLDSLCKRQVLAMLKYINTIGYDNARKNIFGKLKEV